MTWTAVTHRLRSIPVLHHIRWLKNLELWAITGLAILVMLPRLQAPYFGLLDDPTILNVARGILEENPVYPFVLGQASGRFFPIFWYFFAIQYALWEAQPLGFYMVECGCLIITALALSRVVKILSESAWASLIAGVLFVLAPPIIENYYTLGKTEVQLTLYLSVSIWCLVTAAKRFAFRRLRFAASILLLLFAYLTKETALVLVPVSICWLLGCAWLYRAQPAMRRTVYLLGWYSAATVVCAISARIFAWMAGVALISSGSYSQNYAFTTDILLNSLFGQLGLLARDYSFLFWLFGALILTALWDWRSIRATRLLALFGAAIIWGGGFLGILLPWRSSVQEYYLLPASVGLCAAAGFGIEIILRVWRGRHRERLTSKVMSLALFGCTTGLVVFLASAPINMQANGAIETMVDRQNMAMIDTVARMAPNNGTVLFNIQAPNEYIVQAATYLHIVKQRPDLHIDSISNIDLPQIAENTLILTLHIRDTPTPTVRMASYSTIVDQWNAELLNAFPKIGAPIYDNKERIPLTVISTHQWVCPIMRWADQYNDLYATSYLCSNPSIVQSLRMEYGWSIYEFKSPNSHSNTQVVTSAAQSPSCAMKIDEGWYDYEHVAGDWWRWAKQQGTVHLMVDQATEATLRGYLYAAQQPNTVAVLVNGVLQTTIQATTSEFAAFEINAIPLNGGVNEVTFVSGNPAVEMGSDHRKLAIAVRNLQLATDSVQNCATLQQ